MAELADPFGMSIDQTLPASWEQDPSIENVFAWLRPINEHARHAFHLVVDKMVQNPGTQLSARKFIHLDGRATFSPRSASESEDPAHEEAEDQSKWNGTFKFSTTVHPKDPAKGWFIGTGRGKPEVDVLIGPQDPSWINNKVRSNHARLYLHMESCRPMVQALHTMEVSGKTGTMYMSQRSGVLSKALEHGNHVQFGRCAYVFLCGDAMTSGLCETSLQKLMKLHYRQFWKPHPILSLTSTGSYHQIDQFTFFPGAFAQGAFGEVTAGWAQDGSAVAIKRVKYPNQRRFDLHLKIMGLIGRHANIVQLIHYSVDLKPKIPAVYYIYSPLAMSSLEGVISSYTLNISGQIALLVQYLQGLTYLHDVKGIMHRDIKPCNLGVLSLDPPRGIILDLDGATTEETSDDAGYGSLPFQAPELINLRFSDPEVHSYGKAVDVWALGITAFFALRNKHALWPDFDDGPTRLSFIPGTNITQFVTRYRLEKFHQSVQQIAAPFEQHLEYFEFLEQMTLYDPKARFSASVALKIAGGLKAGQGEIVVNPRYNTQGTKRKIEEIS